MFFGVKIQMYFCFDHATLNWFQAIDVRVDTLGIIEPPEYTYGWTAGFPSAANGHSRT